MIRPRLGRLLAEETAKVLGFHKHEIPILVRANLLKPIGNPPRRAVKYFFSETVETLARDEQWMVRATKAIYKYWAMQNDNRRRKARGHSSSSIQPSPVPTMNAAFEDSKPGAGRVALAAGSARPT
jgi:hypothetical protein